LFETPEKKPIGICGRYHVPTGIGKPVFRRASTPLSTPEEGQSAPARRRPSSFNTPETVELLRKSGPEHPTAQLVLANVLLKRHETEDAVAELRAYLHRPEVSQEDKKNVACLVDKLTRPPGAIACAQ
jgi:hypothetical protein